MARSRFCLFLQSCSWWLSRRSGSSCTTGASDAGRPHYQERSEGELERLTDLADRMGERIETLEAILDAETPDWRKRDPAA